MEKRVIQQLTIFFMDSEEFEDASLKNRCLKQSETTYLAYVRKEMMEDDEILSLLLRKTQKNHDDIMVFCMGVEGAVLDYAGIFELLSVPIGGIIFPKTLVKATGAFNEKLLVHTNLELMCRLVKETDACEVMELAENIDYLMDEGEWIFSCAYIIRRHMENLHKLGLMEKIFTYFSAEMQAEGVFLQFQQQLDWFLSNENEYEKIARLTAPFIVLRKQDTCGDVLKQFIEELSDSLIDCGQAVIEVDTQHAQMGEFRNSICKGIIGFQEPSLGSALFRNIHGPKFQFWFDDPLDNQDMLCDLPENYYILCQNADCVESVRNHYHIRNVIQLLPRGRAEQLIALAEEEEASLKIFVATHVKFTPPQNPIYVPLHVGRSGKTDLGYLGDNTGNHISDLNFLYGELTGLFWIWQNVDYLDYVGLCHYRRYFINTATKREMQKWEYLELLERCDAIVPRHETCEESYYCYFCNIHGSHNLDVLGRALKRVYPEYGDAFDQAMQGNIYYWGNLLVAGMDIVKSYSEWLFTIFAEVSDEIDVEGYDDYHRRVYGFLSEQMFYVYALANHLTLHEAAVGLSGEKAETRELRELLKQLMAEDKQPEARELLIDQLKSRPDLLLPLSDVTGELKDIYEQLIR
ncbi:MAG: DUF4422 domain-containing protein [Acetatifactor sp.]|nr:DUF4422 domain-containing protein [Acetatifactor sp.]